MAEATYSDPNLALNRIYTKRGDSGQTSLVNGRRIPKDDLKIEAFGTVDELNSYVGQARATLDDEKLAHPTLEELAGILMRVQHELFNLGSLLATDPDAVHPQQAQIAGADIEQLEAEIDRMNAVLPALRSFVLPGGTRLNAELHVCRTVCRRAERIVTALARQEEVSPFSLGYLNRLSDAFFVWSRWASVHMGAEETLWQPNEAASGAA